jgi:hypothetical protein
MVNTFQFTRLASLSLALRMNTDCMEGVKHQGTKEGAGEGIGFTIDD